MPIWLRSWAVPRPDGSMWSQFEVEVIAVLRAETCQAAKAPGLTCLPCAGSVHPEQERGAVGLRERPFEGEAIKTVEDSSGSVLATQVGRRVALEPSVVARAMRALGSIEAS